MIMQNTKRWWLSFIILFLIIVADWLLLIEQAHSANSYVLSGVVDGFTDWLLSLFDWTLDAIYGAMVAIAKGILKVCIWFLLFFVEFIWDLVSSFIADLDIAGQVQPILNEIDAPTARLLNEMRVFDAVNILISGYSTMILLQIVPFSPFKA